MMEILDNFLLFRSSLSLNRAHTKHKRSKKLFMINIQTLRKYEFNDFDENRFKYEWCDMVAIDFVVAMI